MVSDVKKDLKGALDLLDNKDSKYYSRLYSKSNEALNKLFSNFDVKGKKILTVLASSDQLFLSWYLGAKDVDTFDINRLTIYYYYLRKWVMKYKHRLYPVKEFFKYGDLDTWKLIYSIEPSTKREEEAKYFWLNYLNITNGLPKDYLFFNMNSHNIDIDISKIKKKLDKDITFYNLSIFETMNIDKKYDYIIASNILEYTTTKKDYEVFAENIKRLLNDDGMCICSYIMNDRTAYEYKREKKVIESMGLEAVQFNCYSKDQLGFKKEIGYAYVKK